MTNQTKRTHRMLTLKPWDMASDKDGAQLPERHLRRTHEAPYPGRSPAQSGPAFMQAPVTARRALTLGRFVELLSGNFNRLGERIARLIERLTHGTP